MVKLDYPKYKKGDQIKINSADSIVKRYITDCVFTATFKPDYLRALCLLSSNKKYTITDVCESCEDVRVKVADGKFVNIRFREIRNHYPK